MKKILIILAMLATFAFSQLCDMEVAYGNDFKDVSDCNTGNCSVTLPNSASIITLRPTPCSETDVVIGAFENAYLQVGTSNYNVNVGGYDYTISITREAGSSSPNTVKTLSGLTVTGGNATFQLNPVFAAATTAYTVEIPYATETVTVSGTHGWQYGYVEYLDETSQKISNQGIPLLENVSKTVKVRAYAEAQTAGYTDYTLSLTRAEGNTNNNLSTLEVYYGLNGELFEDNALEVFNADETEYELNVPYSTQIVTVRGSKAEQYVGGYIGQNSWVNYSLVVGENEFAITVKPEKGENKTYTLTITRAQCVGDECPQEDPSSSSGEEEPSSSSSEEEPSSSSSEDSSSSIDGSSSSSDDSSSSNDSSSSSVNGDSSSSSDTETPIRLSQIAKGNISVQEIGSSIFLENLPTNTRVELYNLQGERVYLGNSGNSQILKILIQTKGIYIAKVGKQTFRIAVK